MDITAVYVTHDRVEALSLSDSIGVMRSGKIVEIGAPKKIYFNAEHQFVADFIGRSNLIPATVKEQKEAFTIVETSLGEFICKERDYPLGSNLTLCIRPEFIDLEVVGEPKQKNTLTGVMETMVFVGDVYESEIRVGDVLFMAKVDPETSIQVGDPVTFSVKPEHCLLVSE